MKKQMLPAKQNISDGAALFKEIRALILSARKTVVRNVDAIQIFANYEIGRRIVEYEQKGGQRAEYGKALILALADKLTKEFGKGFSQRNLAYMRQFYLAYQGRNSLILQTASAKFMEHQTVFGKLLKHKMQTVSAQSQGMLKSQTVSGKFDRLPLTLSWSHYVFLMGLKDENERNFYEIEAGEQNWSLRELERQFNAGLYERLALSRDKKGIRDLSRKGQVVARPEDLLKEPYVLEFLGLDEKTKYSESDLESAIIDKLEHFLLELGKGFLFEARQKRFTFDADHFFVDLVFYNRLLKCYVLIDLKIGKLTHQDLGQMQMYVNYFDRHVKTKEESSTVGIVLCRKNREALVEITLPKDANIHAKEYRLYLPSKEELKNKLLAW